MKSLYRDVPDASYCSPHNGRPTLPVSRSHPKLRIMAAKKVEAEPEEPRPTVREAMRSVLASAKLVAGAHGLDRQGAGGGPVADPQGPPPARRPLVTRGLPDKRGPAAPVRPGAP